ncbi:hypothetical protein [Chroogloeocystis siderophila]|jgi:hypothetical protein|uniref:hypothetical protein n=1 Tax=Chroogloeocystis siderophila TaxID=329163 RepID=UPI001161029B|nr:hypothetical protein [Chroogloeocystis siderophila]
MYESLSNRTRISPLNLRHLLQRGITLKGALVPQVWGTLLRNQKKAECLMALAMKSALQVLREE